VIRRYLRNEKGAVAPVLAVYLLVAVGIMALVLDLGHIFLLRCELQRVADSAALAGALRLMTPVTGSPAGVLPAAPDCARALTAAQTVSLRHNADGQEIALDNLSLSLGTWNGTTFTDTACANPAQVNAVRAVATKTTSVWFGGLITGKNTLDVSATATVLVGSVGGLPPGFRTMPLAVDAEKLPSDGQKLVIHLNPTPGDDGCWHTFFWQNPSDSLIRDIINGQVETPYVKVGDLIKVKEGVSDSDLKALGKVLKDNGGTMDVVLPVIPPDSHTGWAEVLGFAAVRLNLVDSQGQDKRVEAVTLNNRLTPTALPGGSNYYGLYTASPRMVQ
jgi:hypothetical protein